MPARRFGDERLAHEIASGNEPAFTALFNRYHQPLYRYCRSLTGNEQDAQDALQAAFSKALVALREARRSAPVRPWLFRIAHNESISVIRARSNAQELPTELEAGQGAGHSVEERERFALLIADLRALPERQRGALVMRELGGLSHEEISQALQVSVGASKQLILEARRSMMEFEEGRAMGCDEVQRLLSDGDGRSLRGRKVRAHLRGCASCTAFAAAIPRRRADMQALFPVLPAAGAAGLLAKITGAGSGHSGGGAGLMAGTAAKVGGATISAKVAAAAGAAVVATATVGAVTVTVLHHQPAGKRTATSGTAARGGNRAAPSHSPASGVQLVAGDRRVSGAAKQLGNAGAHRNTSLAGKHGAGHGNSVTHSVAATHTLSTTHGKAGSAPGHSSSSGVTGRGHSQSTHAKPVKVTAPVKHVKATHAVHHTAKKTKRTGSLHKKASPPKHETASGGAKTTGKGKSQTTTPAPKSPTSHTTTSPGSSGNGGQGSGGASSGRGGNTTK